MIPQVLYGLMKGAQALFGSLSSSGGRSPRVGFEYMLYAVPPTNMQRFLSGKPEALPADEIHDAMLKKSYFADAEVLSHDIREMQRRYPGCVIMLDDLQRA